MNREVGAMRRPKALVFIDFDMVIRHFILSGAFCELEWDYDVKYVFHTDETSPKQGIYADVDALGLKNYSRFPIPRKRMGTWNHLYCPTVLNNQRGTVNYESRLKLTYLLESPKWVRRYEFLSLPGIFQIFRFVFSTAMGAYKPLSDFVRQESPDIVIHPTVLQGYFINELVPICNKQNIPFLCLMNSWDNPSQKAAATGLPDKLVVWGEQTRRHAIELMGMAPDDVIALGAAQFEAYRRGPDEPADELRRLFGVPEGKKIILYAGAGNGRHETRYLGLLEDGIEDGTLAGCHVIYRPHPWRGGLGVGEEDFFARQWRHITMDPHMDEYYRREIKGSTGRMLMADYRVSNRLLTLADAVISPLSTMLVEAVLKGKPVLIFFPERDHEVHFSTDEVHFKDFLAVPEVNVCLKEAEFYPACRRLVGQIGDGQLASALRTASRHFVDMNDRTYGERLKALVDGMIPAEGSVRAS